jgi:hypothetical protein
MPSIPQGFLDCVFYLYRTREDAVAGKNYGGAGFFAGIRSSVNQGLIYIYACTNWHVAVKDGFSVLRVNTRDGGNDFFEFDPSDWHFAPQGGDLAVLPIPLDLERQQAGFMGLDTIGDSNGMGVRMTRTDSLAPARMW